MTNDESTQGNDEPTTKGVCVQLVVAGLVTMIFRV